MKYVVFDIETDGLLDKVTKIHCLSYQIWNNGVMILEGNITDPKKIKEFVEKQNILVGHNIILYDIPVLEKLLDATIKARLIDTLGISWYLYPIKGFLHGLKAWGMRLGFPKPPVEDWENLPLEVYLERCAADVEINSRLFCHQLEYLKTIYASNPEDLDRILKHCSFKLDCLRTQAKIGIPLDVDLVKKTQIELFDAREKKRIELAKVMPKMPDKTIPKKPYKKDGSLSATGTRWFELLKQLGLPENSTETTMEGNPSSSKQLKNWLFSLGWVPITFNVNEKGDKVPQISLPFGAGLCPSIIELFETHPVLKNLDSYTMLQHRLSIMKGFLDCVDEKGYVYSTAQGFTNTMRMQHSKPLVNLPAYDKPYGMQCRGALTVPNKDEYLMCGADISGLEDNSKQHYIYEYDPEYVEQMRVPGFDPHMDIALLAGLVTKEDCDFYANFDPDTATEEEHKRYKHIKHVRGFAKRVNFSATYGAGAPKIADSLKCPLAFATNLHKTYWSRNKAVKLIAKNAIVKKVNVDNFNGAYRKTKWLFNPISKFWLFLKSEKDRFSTLNQSSGCYIFDTWCGYCNIMLAPYGIFVVFQYHDELLVYFKKEMKDTVARILKEAMVKTNKKLKLNVKITISEDFGTNYAECH